MKRTPPLPTNYIGTEARHFLFCIPANLLYVNTANTEANQLNLMSHMMAEESQDSQIDKTEAINKEYPAEQRTSKVNGVRLNDS